MNTVRNVEIFHSPSIFQSLVGAYYCEVRPLVSVSTLSDVSRKDIATAIFQYHMGQFSILYSDYYLAFLMLVATSRAMR